MTEYFDDNRRLVSVFRSGLRSDMYLYVDKRDGLQRVPDVLRELFGKPQHTMDLLLTPQRELARVSATAVLDAIRERGFFLQMPPAPDEAASAIIQANEKLSAGRRLN